LRQLIQDLIHHCWTCMYVNNLSRVFCDNVVHTCVYNCKIIIWPENFWPIGRFLKMNPRSNLRNCFYQRLRIKLENGQIDTHEYIHYGFLEPLKPWSVPIKGFFISNFWMKFYLLCMYLCIPRKKFVRKLFCQIGGAKNRHRVPILPKVTNIGIRIFEFPNIFKGACKIY
jgi:hypothetical protein